MDRRMLLRVMVVLCISLAVYVGLLSMFLQMFKVSVEVVSDDTVKYCAETASGVYSVDIVPRIDRNVLDVLKDGKIVAVVTRDGKTLYGFNETEAEKYCQCIEENTVVYQKPNYAVVPITGLISSILLLLLFSIISEEGTEYELLMIWMVYMITVTGLIPLMYLLIMLE